MIDLKNIFGTLKTKMTGQKFKDLAREGWEPNEENNSQIPNES
ncbi:MAG: hypothetical protein WC254_04865 [Candidatus Woesearchaeota archaeon]|jgi:hypothetical protein